MAPSFLLRKSDGKTDGKADTKLCHDSDMPTPRSIRLDWRMQAKRRNRPLLELQPSQPAFPLNHSIAESSVLVADDIPSHTVISPTNSRRFLSALNAILRSPRSTDSIDKETLRPPSRRPRATSVPSKPAELGSIEAAEVPAELPLWLIDPATWDHLKATFGQEDLHSNSLSSTWYNQSDDIDTARFSFVSNIECEFALRHALSRYGSRVGSAISNTDIVVEEYSPEPPSPAESESFDMAGFQSAVPPACLAFGNRSVEDLQPTANHHSTPQPQNGSTTSPPRSLSRTSSRTPPEVAHEWSGVSDDELLALKAAHSAHVSYLNEEHDRELNSLRTHISLLEKRATLPAGQHLSPSGLLPRLDTRSRSRPRSRPPSEPRSRSPSCDSILRPSSASMKSLESALEYQRRRLDEAALENEDLRNLLKQRDAVIAERSGKLAILEQALQVRERANREMKDAMVRGATNENVLKTKVFDLESRLATALGNQGELEDKLAGAVEARLDLEESCDQVKGRVKTLLEQNNVLQKRHDITVLEHDSYLTATKKRANFLEKRLQDQHAAHHAEVKTLKADLASNLAAETSKTATLEKQLHEFQTKLRIEKDHAMSAKASAKRLEDQLRAQEAHTGLITINGLDTMQSSPSKMSDLSPARSKAFAAKLRHRIAELEGCRDKLLGFLELEEGRPRGTNDSPRSGSSSSIRRDSILDKYEYTTPWSGNAQAATYDAFLDEIKTVYERQVSQMRYDIKMCEEGKECYKKDIRNLKTAFRNADKTAFEQYRVLTRSASTASSSPGGHPAPLRVRSMQTTPTTVPAERPSTLRGRRSVSVDSSTPLPGVAVKTSRPVLRHHLSLDTSRGSELQARMNAARRKESGSSKYSWSGTSSTRSDTSTVVHGISPQDLLDEEEVRPLSMVAEAGSAVDACH